MAQFIIKKHISILHSNNALKTLFFTDFFCTIHKINKNWKELIAQSTYPNKVNTRASSITSCNSCDICKTCMILHTTFVCTVTGESYFIKGQLNCESVNVVYLITFLNVSNIM